MTAIDVEALKRFLDSELYSRLEDFYLRQPNTLPRPDFKTFYGWLVGDIAAEFFNHPAKMSVACKHSLETCRSRRYRP
jgi:hypothetical protein